MTPLIELEDFWKVYTVGSISVPALRGVNLLVHEGEYVAIMGHSGSGKSTLLNLLGCLDTATEGRYGLRGEDVSGMSDNQLSEIRNTKIGFVFQSFNLMPQLSVLENIEVPLFYMGMPRRLRRRRSIRLAESVGLGDRIRHNPTELSGGQRQRVAIARGLANDPLVLLADEPTGNLDSETSGDILDLMGELHQRGRTIILVTHELDVAARASRIVSLRDGYVESDTDSLARKPAK